MVSSETQDQHLDDAIKLAYELLHASRMYPGLHWCVGIFKVATGIETVIVSNDGASYIPPGVYVPRSARRAFRRSRAEHRLPGQVLRLGQPGRHDGRLRRRTCRSRSQHRAVRGRRDHRPRRLIRAPRPPRRRAPLSGLRLDAFADRSRHARTGTRRDPTCTVSPSCRRRATSSSTTPTCLRRNVIRRPGRRPPVPSPPPSLAPSRSASKSHPSSAKSSACLRAARRSPTTSGLPSLRCGCTASRCSCVPGFIEVEPSGDPNTTVLYRAHHNLDRAVEALSLWRGDNPDYADIVYATEQVAKEEQLWPLRT